MYANILVPLDGSELAECVLPHIESITSACQAQNVVFLRVVEPFQPPSGYGALTPDYIDRINADNKAAAESYLAELLQRVRYDGVSASTAIVTGKPADSIADYVTKNSIDLVAIATHGRSGISRWAWGSVADRVLRSVCVPVLMVRAPGCVAGI